MRKINYLWLAAVCFLMSYCAPKGEEVYVNYCAGCHGMSLEGTTSGPRLYHPVWKHGSSPEEIRNTIANGVPGTTMIGWDKVLNSKQIDALVSYIEKAQESLPVAATKDTAEYIQTSNYKLKIQRQGGGELETPWGIEFINKDSALISEKTGSLKWMVNGKIDKYKITGLPETTTKTSTGGFMDIAIDPAYKKNKWVYLSYSYTNGDVEDAESLALTKIVRGKINNNHWHQEQTLFEVPDSLMVKNGNRWGCRFLFDKKGRLYFSIGDMGKAMDSQLLNKATGKVFRINPDGSIPDDNPYVHEKGSLPQIYSIGNRNVQGIAIHPKTGDIWMTEHGPKGGDELNILKKGANYGWPVITYGIDYDGSIISEKTHQEGMEQPVVQWTPSIAVCPAEFCSSPLFPKWKNDLLVGALAFQEIRRLDIKNQKVTKQELLVKGLGRIRDLKFGPDGALYVLTNDPDRVLRIIPSDHH